MKTFANNEAEWKQYFKLKEMLFDRTCWLIVYHDDRVASKKLFGSPADAANRARQLYKQQKKELEVAIDMLLAPVDQLEESTDLNPVK